MTQAESSTMMRHGGRLDDARRLYPRAPVPWLDLSTGINPHPWRPDAGTLVDPGPLPTGTGLRRLEATAAGHFGTASARVAAVPGSEIILRLLRFLELPAPIVTVRPTYGTHAVVADREVATSEIERWFGTRATILVANPNNPDGRFVEPARLRVLAERQRRAGGWLVVDEAFADVDAAASVIPLIDDDAPVMVLRSFGKFFGLAGLRLGFVVAPQAVIRRVRLLLGDWPVSAHAIAWGTAAYGDAAWIGETRRTLPLAAAALDATLSRHGLVAHGASPLFRLVQRPDAAAIFERLAAAGILTRPFDYRSDWLRFGLPGTADALARLDDALSHG